MVRWRFKYKKTGNTVNTKIDSCICYALNKDQSRSRESLNSVNKQFFFFAYYRNRVARDTTRVSREGGNLVLRAIVKVKSDEP